MKPLALIGLLLIIGGGIVLAMKGMSYTKDKDTVKLGPLEVSAEEKGFIPPVAGGIALVAGIVLLASSRKKT